MVRIFVSLGKLRVDKMIFSYSKSLVTLNNLYSKNILKMITKKVKHNSNLGTYFFYCSKKVEKEMTGHNNPSLL